MYLGKSYSKDIKVLLEANDYNANKKVPLLWEIDRPEQKSLNITFPHSHTELNTATYKSLLVNAMLYLSNKSLPYSQYFTEQHKILRGDDDKLYSYSLPTNGCKNKMAQAPYRHKISVPKGSKYFVAKFRARKQNDKKKGGLFFKIFVDGKFLFHTADLYPNQEEAIKIKLHKDTKYVEYRAGSYDYFYGNKITSRYFFDVSDIGFID